MWAAGEQGFAEELEAAPPCCASLIVADLLFGADLGACIQVMLPLLRLLAVCP